MPIIIFIIAIFIIISASKSNKNTNNGPTNYNTGNPNPYRNPANQGMPQNPANIQNNPYSVPNRQATQPNPYSAPNRQATQPNPYSVPNRQAMQPNPYSVPNRQSTQPNPYSAPSMQDLNQLKERLYSKYGSQIQNKKETQTNPQTAANRMPQPQQRPVNNAVPKRENSLQTVVQSQQQPDVAPNQDKALQTENVSQNFLSLGTTNTLVLTEAPSSLMMGISDYDFSFWGIGVDKYKDTGIVVSFQDIIS